MRSKMKQTLYNRRLLDVIENISANRESGRLKIQVRTTMGHVFFKDGKLVDAQMGALTGFSAINAAASIPEADFSFDPSVQAPELSFITSNERVVLKQLFGIETVDPQAADNEVNANVGVLPATTIEAQPTDEVIHGLTEEKSQRVTEDDSEVPLVTPRDQAPKVQRITSYALPPSPARSYGRSLYIAILLVLLGAASITLLLKSDGHGLPTSAIDQSASAAKASALVADANESTSQPPTDTAVEHKSSAPQNLTGRWNVVNLVEKTSHQPFNDLKIAFRLRIKQTGSNFTAEGEKFSENGRRLAVADRTPIRLNGSISGDRVEATLIEQGTRRKTSGRFVWRIDKAGGLRGTFDSTAAKTSGKSAATKVL